MTPPASWSSPRLFSRGNAETLGALAEVLVPMDDASIPFGKVDLIGRLETIFEGENPVFLRGTKLSLFILEVTPLLWGFGFRRFSRMDLEGRRAVVLRWEACGNWRLRNLFYSCKVMVLSNLYDDEAVAAAVGYTT